jgi:ABC-2 type transport system ATP-binding protein
VIKARGLARRFGDKRALDPVDFELPRGGFLVVTGPNGSGKTTLLRLCVGLLIPTAGELDVDAERGQVGYLAHEPLVYRELTAIENLDLYGRLYRVPERRERIGMLLERFGLWEVRAERTGSYSRGMLQRLALCRALLHDPELLILDEPLAGMDPIARRKTIRLIKEWGRAGRSVIVSSHVLHEIESMTANILLINQGRILAEGNVHQIRDLIDEHPHTVHVKADETRSLARALLAEDHVLSLKFESDALVVQTGRPDAFYARLTAIAASGELGAIHEVTSPDDNLQAVFKYLVK